MKTNRTYTVINDETGEVVYQIDNSSGSKKLTKHEVERIISKDSEITEEDSRTLYAWCKMIGEINSYGQFKIHGSQSKMLEDDNVTDDVTLAGYTLRVISKAHSYSGLLKANHKTFITNWTELFNEIKCVNKTTQSKLKKHLLNNNLLREMRVSNSKKDTSMNRLVLNPFLMRGASFSSQIAIGIFSDYINKGENMSIESVALLECLGVI